MRTPLALTLALAVVLPGQVVQPEPARQAGTSVTGAFEGWFENPDGTFSLLLGYYNRNRNQEVDVPIGPNNRIEPGGPDRGQPTHFYPGRNWGMFVIKVPKDFGENKITWTLTVNGQTTVIPASLKNDWNISPLQEAAVGNTPPVVSFDEGGPSVQGPLLMSTNRTARVGTPVPLSLWVADDMKYTSNSGARPKSLPAAVRLHWTLYRGPAAVAIAEPRPDVKKTDRTGFAFSGTAATTVQFSEPGDYILHVTANDYSGDGGGGFQCCWSTAQIKFTVTR